MSLVNLNNLKMAFGSQTVFESLTGQINRGDHIGLVGPNGVGKTTLLRLITNELSAVAGNVSRIPSIGIGYLPQYREYPDNQTAFQEVYAGLGELRDVQKAMRKYESSLDNTDQADTSNLQAASIRYAELTDRYQLLGGAAAEAKICALLEGLGVPERIWHNKMNTLSGGERNMIGLANILVGDHDLMLLDEPGNHLDFSGLEWLEHFLKNHPKAFIIVSHNRYTLDVVCEKTWELERGNLEVYTGNYSDYRREKLSKQLTQEATYRRAQKDIKRLEFNIQRLKAWSSVYDSPKLAKTAKVFEKRVEVLKEVKKPVGDGKKMRFRFLAKQARGRIALEAKNYSLQHEGSPLLLGDVNFLIRQGDRIAFVGDNGTGKTSFLRDIVQKGNWEHEQLRVGKSVNLGYFTQLGENLDPQYTVIETAMRLTGLLKGEAADLLYRFLFRIDDLEKSVRVLSGGEKARLQIAALVSSKSDMLLLDEPTNHLDIVSRETIEDALEEFPGTLVIVSHDRYFLNKIADRVFHFLPPRIYEYEGNFSEFWDKRKKTLAPFSQVSGKLHPRRIERNQVGDKLSEPDKAKPKKVKFDKIRFDELEQEIHRLELLRPEIQAELEKLESKGKDSRAAKRRDRIQKLDAHLKELYDEWVVLGAKKKKW